MPSTNELIANRVQSRDHRWFVTGVAGFIGSHLLENLLLLDQPVIGLDNFSTGFESNLEDVRKNVGEEKWGRFKCIRADVCEVEKYEEALSECNVVLHQAALGSVPRSIEEPLRSNHANVEGFLAMIEASRKAGLRRFVYASSSSVYGDSPKLPKVEDETGVPLSPYAVTKATNEMYGNVYSRIHGMEVVGLRYFNVFGARQNPNGAYAAVIPRWIESLKKKEECRIFGDGKTSRDFCYVLNVVEANLLAALFDFPEGRQQVFNIALGDRISLTELYEEIRKLVMAKMEVDLPEVTYEDFRPGDIAHSQASVERAKKLLGYRAKWKVQEGLNRTVEWFCEQ